MGSIGSGAKPQPCYNRIRAISHPKWRVARAKERSQKIVG